MTTSTTVISFADAAPTGFLIKEKSLAVCNEHEVLVEVKAFGVNRADLLQKRGVYPAPSWCPKDVPGLEFSGIVQSVGKACSKWKAGDRVIGLVGGGAFAKHLVVHEGLLFAMPASFDFSTAAALAESFVTAFDALMLGGGLTKDMNLLIHSVSGGVGLAGVQIAKALGAIPVGTTRTDSKRVRLMNKGIRCVLSEGGRFFEQALHQSNEQGFDVVLDTVGASYLEQNLKILKTKGRLISIGLMGGTKARVGIGLLLAKRLSWGGRVLRSRSIDEKTELLERFSSAILPGFDDGTFSVDLDSVFQASLIEQAFLRIENNENLGNVVCTWD